MLDAWNGLDSEVHGAIISGGATLFAAIIAFGSIAWQMGNQTRTALAQVKASEEARLKLQIYEGILQTCEEAADATLNVVGYCDRILGEFDQADYARSLGAEPALPAARVQELFALVQRANKSVIAIIRTVESWGIVDPRMDVFQHAINAASFEFREVYYGKLSGALIRALPMEHSTSGELLPYTWPDAEKLAVIREYISQANGALNNVALYTGDFQREMQNSLVGHLFKHRLEPRRPLDPRHLAITLERRDELNEYFATKTPWGRAAVEAEARVWALLELREQAETAQSAGA